MTTTTLEFHPLAELLPPMEGEEFDALVADIRANGLHDPIVMYEGKILDGRNRYQACLAAGMQPITIDGHEFITDPAVFVISRNIHRRHLTAKQRRDVIARDLIAKLLKAQPEKSNRQIAEQTKADDKTVAAVRRDLEATAEIPQLEKTVGADGKARKQPAKKKTSAAKKAERNRKAREKRAEGRKQEAEAARKAREIETAEAQAKAEQLADDLIKAELAHRVHDYLHDHYSYTLMCAIRDRLELGGELGGNGVDLDPIPRGAP